MTIVTHCPSCLSDSWTDHLTSIDFTVSHETFVLKKCTICSLVATAPRPNDSELSRYYQSDSYISHTSRANSIIDKLYLFIRSFALTWKLNLVNRKKQNKSILDFGCGTGHFLRVCQQDGWKITGIEPSDLAREQAIQNTGSEIVAQLDHLKARKFNVITLWHVLEHIPDINELIRTLSSLLDENGTLFIAVPNYQSYDGQYYREHWAGYDVPRHIWHFTRNSMSRIMSRNSLQITEVIPMKLDSFYVSMLSEKYRRGFVSTGSLFKALLTGLKSNSRARKNGAYSSLIYVITK